MRQVSFKNGRIIAAESSDTRDHLGESLVRRQKLTASELHRARIAAQSSGKTLPAVLTELEILSAAALEIEMTRVERAIVDTLFRSYRGEFHFHGGRVGSASGWEHRPRSRGRRVRSDGARRAENARAAQVVR